MPANGTRNPTDNWSTALRYIAGRKAGEESLGFLAHISSTVRETPGPKDVAPAAAKACVPFFASAVSLDSPATHSGAAVVRGPAALSAAVDGVLGLARAGGHRQLVISAQEGLVKKTDPEHLELLHQWEADSAVALSLDYRGTPGGHLVIVRDSTHRRGALSPGELALASEVADRLAAFNALAAHLALPDPR